MDHTPANRLEQSVSDVGEHDQCNHLDGNCHHGCRIQRRFNNTRCDNCSHGGGETMTKRISVCNQAHHGFPGTSGVPHPETMTNDDSRGWEQSVSMNLPRSAAWNQGPARTSRQEGRRSVYPSTRRPFFREGDILAVHFRLFVAEWVGPGAVTRLQRVRWLTATSPLMARCGSASARDFNTAAN
jgi:hypothetical protein